MDCTTPHCQLVIVIARNLARARAKMRRRAYARHLSIVNSLNLFLGSRLSAWRSEIADPVKKVLPKRDVVRGSFLFSLERIRRAKRGQLVFTPHAIFASDRPLGSDDITFIIYSRIAPRNLLYMLEFIRLFQRRVSLTTYLFSFIPHLLPVNENRVLGTVTRAIFSPYFLRLVVAHVAGTNETTSGFHKVREGR